MKKGLKFWWMLTGQIVLLFVGGMLMTFVNDYLQSTGFFGDTLRTTKVRDPMGLNIDTAYDWGQRHYWYFWMMVVVFILSAIRIYMWAEWFWSDKNKNKYD